MALKLQEDSFDLYRILAAFYYPEDVAKRKEYVQARQRQFEILKSGSLVGQEIDYLRQMPRIKDECDIHYAFLMQESKDRLIEYTDNLLSLLSPEALALKRPAELQRGLNRISRKH